MFGSFSNWLEGLDPTLRTYWIIAILTSLLFVIQMALTLVGVGETDGGADGFDADAHGDTLDTGGSIQLFTIRNMVNFLLGIGWGGVCFWEVIPSRPLLAIVAIGCGALLVVLFMLMYRKLMKLESDGAFRITDAVGVACEVYIRIPAERAAAGKVQISFSGSVQELAAMTDGEALQSGTKVRVTEVLEGQVLLVEKI